MYKLNRWWSKQINTPCHSSCISFSARHFWFSICASIFHHVLGKFWKRRFLEVLITTNMFLVLEFCWTSCSCTLCVLFFRLGVSLFYISLSLLHLPGILTHHSWSDCFKSEGRGWKGPGGCRFLQLYSKIILKFRPTSMHFSLTSRYG